MTSNGIKGLPQAVSGKPMKIIHRVRRSLYRLSNLKHDRGRLEEARKEFPFIENPFVSVRIATYQNSDILINRTIPSVLGQTYQHFEIVVIGDECSPEHSARIESWMRSRGDPRIRFVNLEKRGCYPVKPAHRWQVAGTKPANVGIELAKGDWIAPLDDDDEFTADHIEALLRFARAGDLEFVYGITRYETPDGGWTEIGKEPIQCGQICHLSVMYHRRLSFFRYDIRAWRYGEPGDWNMWRRMKEAGARIGFLPKVVGIHYLNRERK